MASRYEEGLSHNQKRKVRRTLQQRLHLAEHDAEASSAEAQRGVGSNSGAASSSADGGGAAWSSKGAASSGARDRAGAQQRDGAAGAGHEQGGVRSTPSCAPFLDHPEDGLHLGAAPSHMGLRGEGQHGRKREAEPQRGPEKRAKKEEARDPPWRGSVAGDSGYGAAGLWENAVAVRPRWQVERDMDAAKEAASKRSSDGRHFEQMVSKAATALLRWGRADLVLPGGGFRTVKLQCWSRGSWHEVEQLAQALDVELVLLWSVLCSTGRRGERVEVEGSCARALWRE